MKKVSLMLLFVISAFEIGCGNTRFSDQPNPIKVEDAQRARSGLLLKVKNSLPMEQVGDKRVQPHLNAYFCSPLPKDERIPSTDERCTLLPGIARNGSTETYLVTKEQLAAVYQAGGGYGSFEFTDDQQLTSIPWHCYNPSKVILNPNFDSRQDWEVVVNQRFSASYGCLVRPIN